MNKDAVQNERGPRSSTLRRQMAMYMNKESLINDMTQLRPEYMLQTSLGNIPFRPQMIPPMVLDLSMHRNPVMMGMPTYIPTVIPHPQPQLHPQPPPPPQPLTPPFAAVEAICEAAAELVLRNVRWVMNYESITDLPMSDQLIILIDSWKEFFIIGAAQRMAHLNFASLLTAYETMHTGREWRNKLIPITKEFETFQNILSKLATQNIDEYEYECLREIILFKINRDTDSNTSITSTGSSCSSTDSQRQLIEISKIQALHDDARNRLQSYLQRSKPSQTKRFEHLMRIVPHMNSISGSTIEELFFRRSIGEVGVIVKAITEKYLKEKI